MWSNVNAPSLDDEFNEFINSRPFDDYDDNPKRR